MYYNNNDFILDLFFLPAVISDEIALVSLQYQQVWTVVLGSGRV
jgi:hypothetical protein